MDWNTFVQSWQTIPWWEQLAVIACPPIGISLMAGTVQGAGAAITSADTKNPVGAGLKIGVSNATTVLLLAGAGYVGYKLLRSRR